MGLFDIFLSPEKQIEKERKLLEKPDRTVAVITDCQDWYQSETYTTDDGDTDVRDVRMAEATFKFRIDGEWVEYTTVPREGYGDFHVGEQWIVKYSPRSRGIEQLHQQLRSDSPFRLPE